MNTLSCQGMHDEYSNKIDQIVTKQQNENRESIFFVYADGSTSDIYTGKHDSIQLSPSVEQDIVDNGKIVGSVHSHPTGFDPSTIDIITGIQTKQHTMCVATPYTSKDTKYDYILTCLNLSNQEGLDKHRVIRAMRRSSVGITAIGRRIRKQLNMQRFDIGGCRTHMLNVGGISYPATSRPSIIDLNVGGKSDIQNELSSE